jgi:hypothetical protein
LTGLFLKVHADFARRLVVQHLRRNRAEQAPRQKNPVGVRLPVRQVAALARSEFAVKSISMTGAQFAETWINPDV